jgi:hypothetical protein
MADNRSRDPQWALLRQQQSSRGLFSPEIVDLVLPPLKFGGYAGELLCCVLAQAILTSSRDCRCFGRCRGFHIQRSKPYSLGCNLWVSVVYFGNKLLV